MTTTTVRDDLISHYKTILKSSWRYYGLEMVMAADAVVKSHAAGKIQSTNITAYANRVLYITTLKSRLKAMAYDKQTVSAEDVDLHRIYNEDFPVDRILFTVDMEKMVDVNALNFGIQKLLGKRSVKDMSEKSEYSYYKLRLFVEEFSTALREYAKNV